MHVGCTAMCKLRSVSFSSAGLQRNSVSIAPTCCNHPADRVHGAKPARAAHSLRGTHRAAAGRCRSAGPAGCSIGCNADGEIPKAGLASISSI